MNLLEDPWIPVRADHGRGAFQLLTYRALLCEPGQHWQISLPRDDLELACLQLLVCMTQVMFLPNDDPTLRQRLAHPLTSAEFDSGIAPFADWFDLDHPTQPFMQAHDVNAEKITPIQKLLVGLPEGNNHAFFNEAGEVTHLSAGIAAIALFNQASNSPNWSGKYKGGLRGGGPITTLVFDADLRHMVWRNVLTRPRVEDRQILVAGPTQDKPTWIEPIVSNATIQWNEIGLMRGLFWQAVRLRLVKSPQPHMCGVLGGESLHGYLGFVAEPDFKFKIEGLWPHPHGSIKLTLDGDTVEKKFSSFNTTVPAWTQLSEFVIPRNVGGTGNPAGHSPAGPITQFEAMGGNGRLNLLIGGYRTKQATVIERRHELLGLAQGWQNEKDRIEKLVAIGLEAKEGLTSAVFTTSFGLPGMKGTGLFRKKKGRKKIRSVNDAHGFHELAEKLFYARTESLIQQTFSSDATFKEWGEARRNYAQQIAGHCRAIFEELTDPYSLKSELIPVIAWSRRTLNIDLKKLTEETA